MGEDVMVSMREWIDTWFPMDLRAHAFPVTLEEIRQDGALTLRMEIPGIDPATDLEVRVDDGVLTVSGHRAESEAGQSRSEFAYGEFARMVTLPRAADEDSIRAAYRDGILEVRMDVVTSREVSRKIPIDTEQGATSSGATSSRATSSGAT